MNIELSRMELEVETAKGEESFALFVRDQISDAVGGTLDSDALEALNAEQVTLWAYFILRDEVCDGGFVQLIHNGYGAFFFRNPFAKAMRLWGLPEVSKLINKAARLYREYGEEIERDCTDEEFMALFERFPKFDELDDEFVEDEEEYTAVVGQYVLEHITNFITIEANGQEE